MTTAGHTSISDRWASRTTSAYWQKLPMRSMWKLLVAAFITFGGIGFLIDLLLLKLRR